MLAVVLSASAWSPAAIADLVPLINPGGEAYGAGTTNINPGGVPPISQTGWDSTVTATATTAVQSLSNNPHSGLRRLATGSVTGGDGSNSFPPEDTILFQRTNRTVAAGDEYELNFFGRGFFLFTDGVDFLTSFLGYIDQSGIPVQIDVMQHTNVVANVWNAATHAFTVPAGSPLIGEQLAIGFYTTSGDFSPGTPNTGAFSAVDDVSLVLVSPFAPGDVNGDGLINNLDAQIIANHFLNMTTLRSEGDLNSDGIVDFADFRIWKDASGFAGSLADILGGSTVPEPHSFSLAAAASLILLWRVRRGRQA